jgi:pimeloyl-ACP methyl ester carboxylesterase
MRQPAALGSVTRTVGVDVPVLVGVAEHDITTDVRSTAPALRACPDVSLFIVPGAAHNHNIAPTRALLWDQLAAWVEGLS